MAVIIEDNAFWEVLNYTQEKLAEGDFIIHIYLPA